MKKIIGMLVIGLMLSGNAGKVSAVNSFGNVSCGKWMNERSDSKSWLAQTRGSWLMGYLTGLASASQKDFLKETDPESLLLWMDNYCNANPLMQVADGGNTLALELIDKKGL